MFAVERLLEKGYRNEFFTIADTGETWDAVSIAFYHGHSELLEDLSPSCRNLLNVEGFLRRKSNTGIRRLVGVMAVLK